MGLAGILFFNYSRGNQHPKWHTDDVDLSIHMIKKSLDPVNLLICFSLRKSNFERISRASLYGQTTLQDSQFIQLFLLKSNSGSGNCD